LHFTDDFELFVWNVCAQETYINNLRLGVSWRLLASANTYFEKFWQFVWLHASRSHHYIYDGKKPFSFSTYPTRYNMFNFITSSMIFLLCLDAVAGSPAAALQVRQVAAPTGFDMFVAQTS
jgi:hypothetical protein